jgi:RNA polymerase sigma-70 factor (ECF subfamily)
MPQPQGKFESLIQENRKILYKVCHAYCADRNSREDLAQEILIQLWRSFGSFDGRCRFSTWMYRVALNVAISFYRKTKALPEIAGGERLDNIAGQPTGQNEEMEFLHALIERLDPLNKALMLLYLDEHSYREIADALGISETNVATKINRIKSKIREEYGTR